MTVISRLFLTTFGVVIVVSALVTAQPDQPSRDGICETALENESLLHRQADEPFSADTTTIWRPPANSGVPEQQTTAHYYRESAGRVRVEHQASAVDSCRAGFDSTRNGR